MNTFLGIPLLSLVTFLPLLGALLLIFFIPKTQKEMIRSFANFWAVISFLASILLIMRFDKGIRGLQFIEDFSWIPMIGVRYQMGIDGISLLLVLLTTLLGMIAILSSWGAIEERLKEYYACLLFLQTGMIGTFVAADMFLFYVFWEVMLVPMYFLIGIWGSDRRLYSAIKFFLYTLAGSVAMLLAILKLYFIFPELVGKAPDAYKAACELMAAGNEPMQAMLRSAAQSPQGTFNLWAMQAMGSARGDYGALIPLSLQIWLFVGFAIAFAIKVPMFPFHTWLPDAHTDAPTAASIALAAVLLKMGTYGFLRFNLPILGDASLHPTVISWMGGLAMVGIIYGALCAMAQKDMKRLVAYSSVSHLGFAILGIFAVNPNGINGSILHQINHGISTGALFLLVGMLYDRRHTRLIEEFGGIAQQMPNYAAVFMVMILSSMGLPLLNGFIGEFLVVRGALEANHKWAICAAVGIILGAAYLLWLYQRVFFGELTNERNKVLPDLNWREWACILPLLVLVFWIGIYPKPFLSYLEQPTNLIVTQVRPTYFTPGITNNNQPLPNWNNGAPNNNTNQNSGQNSGQNNGQGNTQATPQTKPQATPGTNGNVKQVTPDSGANSAPNSGKEY